MSIATPRPAVRVPMPRMQQPALTPAPEPTPTPAPEPTPTPAPESELELEQELALSCYFWSYDQDATIGQAVRKELAEKCGSMKRSQQYKVFTIYEGNPSLGESKPVWCVVARNVFEAHKSLNEKRLNYYARIDKSKRGRRKGIDELLNDVTPEQAKALIEKLARIAG